MKGSTIPQYNHMHSPVSEMLTLWKMQSSSSIFFFRLLTRALQFNSSTISKLTQTLCVS